MTFRPWLQRVQKLLGTTSSGHSRRHRQAPACAAEMEQFESRQLLSAGALDPAFGGGAEVTTNFNAGGSSDDKGQAIAVQSDGKVLVAGTVERSAGNSDFGIVRYKADGTIDTSFGTNGKVVIPFNLSGRQTDRATGIAVQADGKIVVVGFASATSSDNHDFAVVRLNSNGTLDTTFSGDGKQTVSFGADAYALGVVIQPNGKIVIAGTTQVGSSHNYDMAVARLNSNGTLDTTFSGDGRATVAFDRGGDREDRCRAVALQSDGKIVLAGSAEMNSTHNFDFAVVRLNTDGTLDRSFDNDGKQTVAFNRGGNNFDQANAVAIASGKIVLAGYATANSGGDTDFAVARLNANGSLDASFDTDGKQTIAFNRGSDKADVANAVAVQSDGRIVLAGAAKTVGAESDYAIVRLRSNGSLDTSFDGDGKRTSGLPGDDVAMAVTILPNGRIIGAGYSNGPGSYDFGVARFLNS